MRIVQILPLGLLLHILPSDPIHTHDLNHKGNLEPSLKLASIRESMDSLSQYYTSESFSVPLTFSFLRAHWANNSHPQSDWGNVLEDTLQTAKLT